MAVKGKKNELNKRGNADDSTFIRQLKAKKTNLTKGNADDSTFIRQLKAKRKMNLTKEGMRTTVHLYKMAS